jgi:hypothetical protein
MKFSMLIFSIISFGLTCAANADDFQDLAAKGYRWVTVNGPYACATEQEVRQITSDPTDGTALRMVEDSGAYYLIPGTLVQVLQNDQANGMSEIFLGGITKPLWTYTKFLSARPIRDTYGIVETPQISGLIDPGDVGKVEVPSEPIKPTSPAPPLSRE